MEKPILHVVSLSGGKDSTVTADVVVKALSNPSLVHIFGNTTIPANETAPWKGIFDYFDSFTLYTGKPVIFDGSIMYNSTMYYINGLTAAGRNNYLIKLSRWYNSAAEIILSKNGVGVYNVNILGSNKMLAKESTRVDGASSIAVAEGEYFTAAGSLCKATTDIAVGDTLSNSNRTVITNGGLNEYVYNSSKLPNAIFDGTIVSNVDSEVYFWRIGKLKFLSGYIKLLQAPTALSQVATLPTDMKPTAQANIRFFATEWKTTPQFLRLILSSSGAFNVHASAVTISDTTNGDIYTFSLSYI